MTKINRGATFLRRPASNSQCEALENSHAQMPAAVYDKSMNEALEFLSRHGAVVLFVAVFVEQLGVPLPAAPWLMAAGALSAAGAANCFVAVCAAAMGSVTADVIWFYLGRTRGNRVLKFLCRISLEPDSCVRQTLDVFDRYGMRAVVAAKFVPGLSTLVAPMAGSSGMSAPRFFFFDVVGCFLYAGCFILLGALFSHQLEQIMDALSGLGHGALFVVVGLAILYIGNKHLQRRRLLRKLQMAKITVDELRKKQEAGDNPVILDLRSRLELAQSPMLIVGAIQMHMDQVSDRHEEIPRDRDIVLYCSCPNEESSARVALSLHRKGILRVRPLLGGIEAWQKRNYPMEPRTEGAVIDSAR